MHGKIEKMTGFKLPERLNVCFFVFSPMIDWWALSRCGVRIIGGQWGWEIDYNQKEELLIWKMEIKIKTFLYHYLHWRELSHSSMWCIWSKQGLCEQSCDCSLVWDWHEIAVTCQSEGESHDDGIQILILGTNKLIFLTCFQIESSAFWCISILDPT